MTLETIFQIGIQIVQALALFGIILFIRANTRCKTCGGKGYTTMEIRKLSNGGTYPHTNICPACKGKKMPAPPF